MNDEKYQLLDAHRLRRTLCSIFQGRLLRSHQRAPADASSALILLYQFSVAQPGGDNTLQDEIASLRASERARSCRVRALYATRSYYYIKVIPVLRLTSASARGEPESPATLPMWMRTTGPAMLIRIIALCELSLRDRNRAPRVRAGTRFVMRDIATRNTRNFVR